MPDLDEKAFAAIILEIEGKTELSEIQRAKLLGKELKESTLPVETLLADLGDWGKMSSLNQKEISKFVKNSGVDITEADEKRAFQQTRDLTEIAFQISKKQLNAAKLSAKENKETLKGIGLTFKGGWIEAKNVWNKGFLGLQESVATNAEISNLGSAISQDFSLLTTEFQGLMAMPGMKTIVQGIKFIAAWLAKLAGPMLKRFLFGDKEEGIKNIFGRLKDRFQGKESMYKSKKQSSQEEDMWAMGTEPGDMGASQEDMTSYFTSKDKKSLTEKSGLKPDKDKTDKITKQPDFDTKQINKETKLLAKALKEFRAAIWRFRNTIDDFFTKKDDIKLKKTVKKHRRSAGRYRRSLRNMTKGMRRMSKGFGKIAKRMLIVVAQFFIQVGLFLVQMVVAIAGFIMANLPLIALIALVVLIAVGLFFLIKYLMDNWEKIKIKFNMAVDKFKLAFTKMSNWFKDLGEDIVYKIKWVIAKIKDGIASMANNVITKLNKIPGVNIEKWDESRTEKLEGGREDILGGRIDRDQQLLADFKALSQERGKQLEDAATADADRKAEKDAGSIGATQQINTSVQTDAREVHMSSESTQPTDFVGMRANMALDQ